MRAINAPERPLDLARGVELALERLEDPLPEPLATPAAEARVDRLPRPVALGEIAPRHAGVHPVEHPIEDRAMIAVVRPAGLARRQQRHQPRPLRITELMAAHHPAARQQETYRPSPSDHPLSNTA